MQPPELVTVKLYEPGFRPLIVTDVPVELSVTLPGNRVSVQVPVAGNPFSTTLPVGRSQVGWVTVPGTGGVGVDGWGSKVISCEGGEVHPSEFVTVNV